MNIEFMNSNFMFMSWYNIGKSQASNFTTKQCSHQIKFVQSLRRHDFKYARPSIWQQQHCPRRLLHSEGDTKTERTTPNQFIEDYKECFQCPHGRTSFKLLTAKLAGKLVVVTGYLGARSDISKSLSFVPLFSKDLEDSIQIVSSAQSENDTTLPAHTKLKAQRSHTPVLVQGVLQFKQKPKSSEADEANQNDAESVLASLEIRLSQIWILNTFPREINLEENTNIPGTQRHLQLRSTKSLRSALVFRSRVAAFFRQHLVDGGGFLEVETPLLFKSTPEGAREFLVPSRTKAYAYALPQSPQQFKQILMASGIPKYFQIAKCFRDEDLRADRQPEFTQLDLEMAFTTSARVVEYVETMIRRLWVTLMPLPLSRSHFPRISYENAMAIYGTDKPDMRFGMEISSVGHLLPVDLIGKLGPLVNPSVEAFRLRVSDDPNTTRTFIAEFMGSPESTTFIKNPDGQPGIFFYDSSKPLSGLQPFGFEAAEQVEKLLELQDGDAVVVQARKKLPFTGGSTVIGNLRLALHRAAVAKGLLLPYSGFCFLWVDKFPLFSTTNATDPGQGGSAGISSTHHPFTAPFSVEDIDLLGTNPLEAIADHYDLVVNGVELGGGSRRIHNARVQEYVLRDVLKMSEEKLKDFEHLLEVLRAGCPPHAGFALGFDRLVAMMLGKESIRDVIAFPKSGKGEDLLMKSPSLITNEQLDTYHLQLKE